MGGGDRPLKPGNLDEMAKSQKKYRRRQGGTIRLRSWVLWGSSQIKNSLLGAPSRPRKLPTQPPGTFRGHCVVEIGLVP